MGRFGTPQLTRPRSAVALLLLVSLCLLLALAAAPAARADAVITVNTLADPGPGTCDEGGECSLREAIERVAEGEVSGDVTIDVEAEGEIDISAEGQLEVSAGNGVESIAIEGPGLSQLTIDAGDESRVVKVGEAELRISGLTISGGWIDDFAIDGEGGAGIYSERGSIVLEEVRVTENEIGSLRDGGGIGIEESARL